MLDKLDSQSSVLQSNSDRVHIQTPPALGVTPWAGSTARSYLQHSSSLSGGEEERRCEGRGQGRGEEEEEERYCGEERRDEEEERYCEEERRDEE